MATEHTIVPTVLRRPHDATQTKKRVSPNLNLQITTFATSAFMGTIIQAHAGYLGHVRQELSTDAIAPRCAFRHCTKKA
jgi:hypothetical protein